MENIEHQYNLNRFSVDTRETAPNNSKCLLAKWAYQIISHNSLIDVNLMRWCIHKTIHYFNTVFTVNNRVCLQTELYREWDNNRAQNKMNMNPKKTFSRLRRIETRMTAIPTAVADLSEAKQKQETKKGVTRVLPPTPRANSTYIQH